MRVAKPVIAIAAVLLVLGVLFFSFDWNVLRGPLSQYVSHRFERSFSITANLKVKVARITEIVAHDVLLGNAPWSKDKTMATARRIALKLNLAALFSDEALLSEMVLQVQGHHESGDSR